jgi:hypothetical protein
VRYRYPNQRLTYSLGSSPSPIGPLNHQTSDTACSESSLPCPRLLRTNINLSPPPSPLPYPPNSPSAIPPFSTTSPAKRTRKTVTRFPLPIYRLRFLDPYTKERQRSLETLRYATMAEDRMIVGTNARPTNPTPLSAPQEQQVKDLYYKNVRAKCAKEIESTLSPLYVAHVVLAVTVMSS